ncbi:MAG: dihydrodipicolinate synthase family protein, partial [Firmicutes bacterium]|nr:dihydrodipicolinate synthase family protein [Bacillota bacterium]
MALKDTEFIHGIIPPIITPIDEDEKIDEKLFRDQIEYIIQGGCAGVLVFGSNGEFYVIEDDEMERGLKIAVDQAAGRVPIFF